MHTSCSTLLSITQLLGDEKSLFSIYSEGRNGSKAVEKFFNTWSLFHVTVPCQI